MYVEANRIIQTINFQNTLLNIGINGASLERRTKNEGESGTGVFHIRTYISHIDDRLFINSVPGG